jgi:hypothetical protein
LRWLHCHPSWHAMNRPDGAAVLVQPGLRSRSRVFGRSSIYAGTTLALLQRAAAWRRSTTIARQLVVHRSRDREACVPRAKRHPFCPSVRGIGRLRIDSAAGLRRRELSMGLPHVRKQLRTMRLRRSVSLFQNCTTGFHWGIPRSSSEGSTPGQVIVQRIVHSRSNVGQNETRRLLPVRTSRKRTSATTAGSARQECCFGRTSHS